MLAQTKAVTQGSIYGWRRATEADKANQIFGPTADWLVSHSLSLNQSGRRVGSTDKTISHCTHTSQTPPPLHTHTNTLGRTLAIHTLADSVDLSRRQVLWGFFLSQCQDRQFAGQRQNKHWECIIENASRASRDINKRTAPRRAARHWEKNACAGHSRKKVRVQTHKENSYSGFIHSFSWCHERQMVFVKWKDLSNGTISI